MLSGLNKEYSKMGGVGKNNNVIYALLSIAFVLFIAIFGLKDCKKEKVVHPNIIENISLKPEPVKQNENEGKTVETKDIQRLISLFKELDKIYVMGKSTLYDSRYVPIQEYRYPVKYVQIKENGDLFLYDKNMHLLDVFKIKKEQTNFNMQSLVVELGYYHQDVKLEYHHKKYENVVMTLSVSQDNTRRIKYISDIYIKLNNDLTLMMYNE